MLVGSCAVRPRFCCEPVQDRKRKLVCSEHPGTNQYLRVINRAYNVVINSVAI